jgi:NAD(P)H-dependent FMN reductase
MSDTPIHVLAVSGSNQERSVTRVTLDHLSERLREAGCSVDLLDLFEEPLEMVDPSVTYGADFYAALKARVEKAQVIVIGTPDYHGSMSGAAKNFLDHFWKEFAGKLFGSIVASYEKGLTVTDQLRTVARQCYAWSMPYGMALQDKVDVRDGEIVSDEFRQRLDMFARDLRVYGSLLATQREADLAGTEPGFMARYRVDS